MVSSASSRLDLHADKRSRICINGSHGLLAPDPPSLYLTSGSSSICRKTSSALADVQGMGGFDAAARLLQSRHGRCARSAMSLMFAAPAAAIVRFCARGGRKRAGG